MVAGFDPVKNEMDRRIFYEVTGKEIVSGEFADECTFDEEWQKFGSYDPITTNNPVPG